MDGTMLLEALAIAVTCVLVLVGWHVAAFLRVSESVAQAEVRSER